MKISKDMIIADVIREVPGAIDILFAAGLGCVGCPASQMETLEEAAQVHNLDLNDLMEKLNANLA
ncbi:DUF1858 domain-containing protein [Microaceticoccus formicicus]|uniref:DUF1858 domain-containing protein n=1 Tax=Microaceticoccus formicicus TaxID=3118105 RepID=UPI003CCFFA8A|nr:DUF1858 domain-containing protein [Peptoniphilaceae bacterium AMB_02]